MTRQPAKCVGLVLSILLISSLAAYASSRNPIGPPEQAIQAPELLGTWVEEECTGDIVFGPGDYYFHILPLKTPDKKQIEIVLVVPPKTHIPSLEQGRWLVVDGYATALRNGLFLNLRLVAEGPDKNLTPRDKAEFEKLQKFPYFFAAYQVDSVGSDHRLFIDWDSPMSAIRGGATAGRLTAQADGQSDYFVTDSSANIARYLGSIDKATLFEKQCVFRRME